MDMIANISETLESKDFDNDQTINFNILSLSTKHGTGKETIIMYYDRGEEFCSVSKGVLGSMCMQNMCYPNIHANSRRKWIYPDATDFLSCCGNDNSRGRV